VSTIATLSGVDANKSFSGRRNARARLRAEVSGIPLEGVDYVRTDKNGPVTGLASRCTHLKGITELSKAIGAKV
jgi:hypothetical protein